MVHAIQPALTSTSTTCNSGWRSSTPPQLNSPVARGAIDWVARRFVVALPQPR